MSDRYRVAESADNPETVLAREIAALRRELHDLRGTALARTPAARPIWLTATSMGLISGAASLSSVGGRWSAWQFDADAQEIIAGSVAITPSWSTVNVDLYWSHDSSTATGDVRWTVLLDTVGSDGDSTATTGPGGSVVSSAGTQFSLKIARAHGGTAVPAGSTVNVRVVRNAADASDTFAADAELIGVLITKAS